MHFFYVQEAVGAAKEDKELKFRSLMEVDELGEKATAETCLVGEISETNSNLTPPVNRISIAAPTEDKSSSDGTELSKNNTITLTKYICTGLRG